MQNQSEEAERAPESFLQESYFGSIGYHRIIPLDQGNKENLGIRADRKMVLQSE
ncbi:hypothetical protein HW560_05175 [Paenibacillus sp. E222]|uniref:hypothetical protein n=1 Tax=Paenibacillus sp. E222 TaxID=2748863 RepID=UPI0015C676BB|nr:hypothetical protein [Paenibacillus sp. E222]QLG37552.1 hypothetical protein HW560_05175 [Paenibacillus sp. E222]